MSYWSRRFSPHHGGFHQYGRFGHGGIGWGRWGRGRGWGSGRGWHHGGGRWRWLGGGEQEPMAASVLPWAQSCLAQLFGPGVVQDMASTRQAIQQFQTQQQLPVTGDLDGNTVSALQAACSAQQGGGQDAGQAAQAPQQQEFGGAEFDLPKGHVTMGPERPNPCPKRGQNRSRERDFEVLQREFDRGVRDDTQLTDAVFYDRNPEWRGRTLPRGRSTPEIEALKDEWRCIFRNTVQIFMAGHRLEPEFSPNHELPPFGAGAGMPGQTGQWVRHQGRIVLHGV
jgi:Putative peptidoglycan binding domain